MLPFFALIRSIVNLVRTTVYIALVAGERAVRPKTARAICVRGSFPLIVRRDSCVKGFLVPVSLRPDAQGKRGVIGRQYAEPTTDGAGNVRRNKMVGRARGSPGK